jgi:hypothetical protein
MASVFDRFPTKASKILINIFNPPVIYYDLGYALGHKIRLVNFELHSFTKRYWHTGYLGSFIMGENPTIAN